MNQKMIPILGTFLFLAACSQDSLFSTKSLSRRLDRLRPIAEKVVRKPILGPMSILALRRDQLDQEFIAKELATHLRTAREAGVIKPEQPELAPDSIETYFAFYSASHTIYVLPEAFAEFAAKRPELSGVEEPAFLDLVLIHEIVHAFQHQELGPRFFIGEGGAPKIHSALFEGHAQHVTRKAATEMGLQTQFALMETVLRPSESALDSEFQELLGKTKEILGPDKGAELIGQLLGLHYIQAENFFEVVAKKWGQERAFNFVFHHPPEPANEILDPEGYLEKHSAKITPK